MKSHVFSRTYARALTALGLALVLAAFTLTLVPAQTSPIHPTFPFLDDSGENVLTSGNPVSTIQTCGTCHDSTFIEQHSFHARVGLDAWGSTSASHTWDSSPGLFGNWDALNYALLGEDADTITTPEWLQTVGLRHVGGGPAMYSREGALLTTLSPDAANPETSIRNESGDLVAWDWNESGVVEMNCFLCHSPNPDNDARVEMLTSGNFGWANTATLTGSGIVIREGDTFTWNSDAFTEEGELVPDFVALQDPGNENCGVCHGETHNDLDLPLVVDFSHPENWSTLTTGQIFSAQRISESGMNISGKNDLSRSWDVHAERVVGCTDCHYSLNNPVYYQAIADSQPKHLDFDPRRLEIGEYLQRPLHQFAKGTSAQSEIAPELDGSLRRCESCHNIETAHAWLPYVDRHVEAVSCESCHIPQINSPALESVNWTVLTATGDPVTTFRGVEEDGLITGYSPALLPRTEPDGTVTLAPHNLVAAWYWVSGGKPVPETALKTAFFDGDTYASSILSAFDANNDGTLSDAELMIDTDAKESAVKTQLAQLGYADAAISGEVQPYSINHTVTNDEWATRDCVTCHHDDSRLATAFTLSGGIPGGVMPQLLSSSTTLDGSLTTTDNGALFYEPDPGASGLYIIGSDSVTWVDWFGILSFLGVLVGVVAHGGLRAYAAYRNPAPKHEVEAVYMYTIYERFWHWLQTFAILLLIFTGLIIHKPAMFGAFSFAYVVVVHNVLGFLLTANAGLSLFYHLASGEIQQYIPKPRGFFNQAITQAKFYLQGIFKGAEHPFEKTVDRKLNPLQQVTYFAILNVLLPLQIVTGVLMWGAQRFPDFMAQIGGLTILAPFHTLVAWSFASFIVMHVYLTTTGHTPTAAIKAMMVGWDEVEVHNPPAAAD